MKKLTIPILRITSQGGVKVLLEIANFFSRNNWNVEIYTSIKESVPFDIDKKIKIKTLTNSKSKLIAYSLFLLRGPFEINGNVVLSNFFITFYISLISSFFRKNKLVYFVQGIESIQRGFFSFLLNRLCNYSYIYKKIIASNNSIKTELKKKFANDVPSIDIGISDIFFKNNLNKTKEKNFDLIYFARREKFKGLDDFFKIVKYLDINILVVGQDKELLKTIASKLKIRDKLTVACPKNQSELINFIDQAKTYLYTSKYEGFGLPPLECMSRGLPGVIFDNTGIRSYALNTENSFIVKDTNQAITFLKKLLSDEKLRKDIGDKAIKTSENFRLSDSIKKLQSLLDEL